MKESKIRYVLSGDVIAEPISTSTPQMICKVKRASNDNQKTMKKTKARYIYNKDDSLFVVFTRVCVKFVIVVGVFS